jgi:hypothetical protein
VRTFKRTCCQDYTLTAQNGDTLVLKAGEEYITSAERDDGLVVVFTQFWVPVPLSLFRQGTVFTKS